MHSVHKPVVAKQFYLTLGQYRRRRKVASRSGRVGIAGYIFTDFNGAFNRTGLQGTYAYHIPWTGRSYLRTVTGLPSSSDE